MLNNILLAIIQAATEFLPVSSSGHLALVSNFISEPDLFLFTTLHLASLVAVIIFTRKELKGLLRFNKEYIQLWLYLIVATIPAALLGFLFKDRIEESLSSLFFIGAAFIFTGVILFLTRFTQTRLNLNAKNAILIGLAQAIALFPGISRSGITVSSALFLGIEREKATKFSFLLFIPLSLGAFILEMERKLYFDPAFVLPFVVCTILSLLFLNLLLFIVKKGKLWLFSVYCFLIGSISLFLRLTHP